MTEEGVDAGGKAGMSRKKVIAAALVAVVVIAGVGAIIMLKDDTSGGYPIRDCEVYWNAVYTESGWRVEVLDIVKNHEKQSLPTARDIMVIVETTLPSKATYSEKERFWLNEVTDTPSPYGISWIGKNKFTEIEIGDYIFINRSGGNAGKLTLNDSLYISGYINSWPGSIYLPPAEFLEMDVVKTATGWNMTVTWVNETVPTQFLEGWNVSFRLENKSGEFLTSFKNDYSFWLGFIRSPLPEYNHVDQGFYNVIWYDYDDNKIISLNDTFVIDNYSGLVKADYTLRLMSNRYGSGHTMIEVVLV